MPNQPLGYAQLLQAHVLLVGAGRESAAIARKLLRDQPDQRISVIDGVDGESVDVWRAEFGAAAPVAVLSGEENRAPDDVRSCTMAVLSPGVPRTGALHRFVVDLGIPMTSGSALFVADHHDTMVGVTGSKGKSTTSALTHQLLAHSGVGVTLAGNMGIPVQGVDPADFYVIELSSYQCHYLQASPDIVVLTALFPEHLDWHGSEQAYYDDKLSILSDESAVVIANAADPVLCGELHARYPDREIVWVGPGHAWQLEPDPEGGSWFAHGDVRVGHTRDLSLVGEHNHQNALLALVAAHTTGLLDERAIATALRSFAPLPHRLQRVSDPSGVVFVNDSLATNPQATVAALRALDDAPVILVVGGADRGVDYQVLADQVVATPPTAVLGLPDSGQRLLDLCEQALVAAGKTGTVLLQPVSGMHEAVTLARGLAEPGDYVVLSPGAPSFGHYRDYAHRAEDFMDAITSTQKGSA